MVGDLVEGRGFYLLRNENLRVAMKRFETSELETLPVLDSSDDRRVVGYLTEAYALRRYAVELERQRGGSAEVFPLAPTKNV